MGKNNSESYSLEFAQDLLSGKYGFMCQYKKELNFETVWSSIFDVKDKKIYRAEGNPLNTKYIEDERLIFK